MLADKEGEKMEKLIDIIAAMDEEEKKVVVKQIASDILFEELRIRDMENRKTIEEIQDVLTRRTNAIR